MPTTRTLFVSIILVMLLAWAGVIYISSYSQVNNLTPSNVILAYGNLSTNNTPSTGIFSGFHNLSGNVNTTQTGIKSSSLFSNPITTITTAVTVMGGFITSLPTLLSAIIGFIAYPFQIFGLPLGFAQTVAIVIIVGVLSFVILSAIFLFPI